MKRILKERKVKWLLHFTKADNLRNILKYGLLSRQYLQTNNIDVNINDTIRTDNCENATCMSIEFPNYKMFYQLRKLPENKNVDWAVLLVDARAIYELECAFCVTNAGNHNISSVSLEDRQGKDAFLKLFDDYPNQYSRRVLNLKDKYPTNPQAEVLVFDPIPTEYFAKVFFKDKLRYNKYIDLFDGAVKPQINNKAFSYRSDWQFWKGVS